LDEASAALGLARALCQAPGIGDLLIDAQRDLYLMMAEVSATPENATRFRSINAEHVLKLEAHTDRLSALVEVPRQFILPGDTPGAGALSLARTIVRRAERKLVRLIHEIQLENTELIRYLNRLSSLCFVLELYEIQYTGRPGPTFAKESSAE
jgi:cob(I)alamin adenosyltransferase